VDELRTTQDQLIQSAKLNALGEMAGGVAHDFNNVLTAILGRTQLLLRWVRDAELRESLRVIERTALDGAHTVRRIQEFTRLRHDQGVESVDLNQVLRDVVELTRTAWESPGEAHGAAVTTELELRAVRRVRGRAAELREVFTNLVLNALDAMPGGGVIRLSSHDIGESVVVRVSDSGIGMDAATQARIFDPFFTTKAQKGTGLGLSVAYGIVTRHEGRIEVESAPERGAIFTLTFPACAEEAATAPSGGGEGGAATMRVLCVDDERPVLEVMGELLEALGQEVETALGGVAGIEAARRGRPDVVFTDLGMPIANGWEVAAEVKRRAPETPIVLVTGWGVQLEPESARERGVDYILPKPYTLEEVRRILSDISERRKAA
jgi:CheY-like chemotaxis protein